MRLVIIGAGFAGMYAALSAARLRDIQGVSSDRARDRTGLAGADPGDPSPALRAEARDPDSALADVLKAIDVVYVRGHAETIDIADRKVEIVAGRKQAARRSPTIGWLWPPAAGCSVRIFPVSPSTHSASTARGRDRARPAPGRPCEAAGLQRARHGRRCWRRFHRHRGRDRDAGAAAPHPRQECESPRVSSSTAMSRSPPTWVRVPGRSSRTRSRSSE